ncbi:MAG TPA: hypothetical protein PKV72_05290 [Candidatus Peribacteria bacterium]|nr:hypothetical protein [Candidatus Peribacteria bacterium]
MRSLWDVLTTRSTTVSHYHGDIVRKLFLTAGALMLATTPFFQSRLPVSAYAGMCVVLVLDVAAAMMNPLMKRLAYFESAVALIGCATFEFYAIRDFDVSDGLFWTNQALALLFFFALYYAVKTARGAALRQQVDEERKGA